LNKTEQRAHICNCELQLTFRRQLAVATETAITIEPYLAQTIET